MPQRLNKIESSGIKIALARFRKETLSPKVTGTIMSNEYQNQNRHPSLFTAIREALSSRQLILLVVVASGLLVTVFFLGIVGQSMFTGSSGTKTEIVDDHQHDQGEGVTQSWSCSMHPQIQKNGPGKCPICAMDLIPVKASTGRMLGLRQVSISPESRALMQIQVTPVERRSVETLVRMVGKVDYDETRMKYITAWVPGRLDRLFVDYTGLKINKGDHLVNMYSEELYSAQQELIEAAKSARKNKGEKSFFNSGGINLLESTREKLRLLGLTKTQIAAIEKQDKPSENMTIYSPMSGIVIEKLRQQGDRVKTGDRIYTVADLNQVWVKMDAYESDLQWIRYGQNVMFTTEAYPGETFTGRIAFIDPVLNQKTRTVKVRVNVANTNGKLKPEMFVRGTVKAQVAAGGKVIDPSLAGKWLSPMHPEVVRNKPGNCPVCGMPLVRAESLGYISPATKLKPLVIPASAILMTGTRAIVYVEVPTQPEGLQAAYQILVAALDSKKMLDVRSAFRSVKTALHQPHDKRMTSHAQQLWANLSTPVRAETEKGRSAKDLETAKEIFESLSQNMEAIHDHFVSPNQPTYLGREIVLGPRAGNYYLVQHGLHAGEVVVTNGNFKIDSALQIQAKPSMMTPSGGGDGGGHNHGGSLKQKGSSTQKKMDLPLAFRKHLLQLQIANDKIIVAVKKEDLKLIQTEFASLRKQLEKIKQKPLAGHPQMLWGELSMLLGNDAFEGSQVTQLAEAQRLFQSLQKHMQQLRDQFGFVDDLPQSFETPAKFQTQLAGLWQVYLRMGDALASDDYQKAYQSSSQLSKSLEAIDMKLLTDSSAHVAWMKELENLKIIQADLIKAKEIKTLRTAFKLFSDEIQVLAVQFGFGQQKKVYQLHCPMAFGNKGAIWLQQDDKTRNPYFGKSMLKCADRTEVISGNE